MRVEVVLAPKDGKRTIPFNYQHRISSIIYKILSEASSEFSKRQHDVGFVRNGKPCRKCKPWGIIGDSPREILREWGVWRR